MSDVARLEQETGRLRAQVRRCGGCAHIVSSVAMERTPLLAVPATDAVKTRLGSALAHLRCLAGACCLDSDADDTARYHCAHNADRRRGR